MARNAVAEKVSNVANNARLKHLNHSRSVEAFNCVAFSNENGKEIRRENEFTEDREKAIPNSRSISSNRSCSSTFTDTFSYENKNRDSDTSNDMETETYSFDDNMSCDNISCNDCQQEDNGGSSVDLNRKEKISDHIFLHMEENFNRDFKLRSTKQKKKQDKAMKQMHETWNQSGTALPPSLPSTSLPFPSPRPSSISSYIPSIPRTAVSLNADDVIITSGCSGAVEMAISVLLNEGDNLLVPRYRIVLHFTIHHNIVQCCAVLCCTVLFCMMLKKR